MSSFWLVWHAYIVPDLRSLRKNELTFVFLPLVVYTGCAMRVIVKKEHEYLLRFDREENALDKLIEFCSSENITAAWFTGIGAADQVILSYYNLPTKSYQDKEFSQEVEVLGITGNIATLDGKTVYHCHGSIGDENYQVFGGHFKKLVVSATLEIHLSVFPEEIKRGFDEPTGLNLLQ